MPCIPVVRYLFATAYDCVSGHRILDPTPLITIDTDAARAWERLHAEDVRWEPSGGDRAPSNGWAVFADMLGLGPTDSWELRFYRAE